MIMCILHIYNVYMYYRYIYIYVCVCILVVRSSSGYFSSSRFRPLKWAWHHGMGLGRTCRYYSYSSSSWIFHVCVIAAAARRVRLGVRRARFGRRFLLDLKHCRRHVYRIVYIYRYQILVGLQKFEPPHNSWLVIWNIFYFSIYWE